MAMAGRERRMTTQRIETQLDEATIEELDGWRATLTPRPSRSEAVRLLLEEHLSGGRCIKDREPHSDGRFPSVDRLGALYTLERVTGFGPVKFRAMHEADVDPQAAIENPNLLPFTGRTGEKLRCGIVSLSQEDVAAGRARAIGQLEHAHELSASILTHGDPGYPENVYESNDPVPVLYVRGDPGIWDGTHAVAVVGSRNTRDPYSSGAQTFAEVAARRGMVVVSGFAMGADSIGHSAAMEAGGRTVCVMPCGLDKVFPPENRVLWNRLLQYPGAVFVTEFGFGQRASSLMLRKRNKLIVAFVRGVLVAQSAEDGGAMNAYRFGRDQRKPVATFRADGSKETSGNVVIERDNRTGGMAFEMSGNAARYEAWLQQLSS